MGRILRLRTPHLLTALLAFSVITFQAGCDSSTDSLSSLTAVKGGVENRVRGTEFRIPETVLLLNCSSSAELALTGLSVRDASVVSAASGDLPADQNPGGSYACHDGMAGIPPSRRCGRCSTRTTPRWPAASPGPAAWANGRWPSRSARGCRWGRSRTRGTPPTRHGTAIRSSTRATCGTSTAPAGCAVGCQRTHRRAHGTVARPSTPYGEPLSEVSLGGGVAWRAKDSDLNESAIHPTGGYIAEPNAVWNQLQLRKRGVDRDAGTPLSKSADYGGDGPRIPRGSTEVPDCSPEFLLDSRDLICSHAGKSNAQILRVRFTVDLQIVRDVEPLLPEADLPPMVSCHRRTRNRSPFSSSAATRSRSTASRCARVRTPSKSPMRRIPESPTSWGGIDGARPANQPEPSVTSAPPGPAVSSADPDASARLAALVPFAASATSAAGWSVPRASATALGTASCAVARRTSATSIGNGSTVCPLMATLVSLRTVLRPPSAAMT